MIALVQRTVNYKDDDATIALLDSTAHSQGLSRSALLRMVVRAFLKGKEVK